MLGLTAATVLITLGCIAASALLTYAAGCWFWGTEYSRTNKAGDAGGPFGGVWVTFGPGFLVGFLAINYGASFMPGESAIVPFIASAVTGSIVGFWTMSKKRGK